MIDTLMEDKLMAISRRGAAALALLLVATGWPVFPAHAQSAPAPLVVYDNELKNGWQNWSWAKINTPALSDSLKPLRVEGDPWSALVLHHDAFSTAPFSKLTFYIHGGLEGGQPLTIRAMADGKAIESNYVIRPKARAWTVVEVALKDLAADNRTIDSLMVQGGDAAYQPYYITRIQLE
jgi:hypothetical protein